MLQINVYKDISKEDVFFSLFGMEDPFCFSADSVQKILSENPTENEITLNINCNGGSTSEGLRIYDILRTSGKTIYCNIENSCHSMAVILLLAAPLENRSANPNSRALIHEVYSFNDEPMNAGDLRAMADAVDQEQNAILDIYAERTGTERTILENLMKEEKVRTAQELKQHGFISKINTYNTNKKKNEMSKQDKKGLINLADKFLSGLKNLLTDETVNYDFTDADGNVLFSTEKADDSLAVGDAVTLPDGSTDGTFTIEDGRTIVITGGKVESITDPTNENEEVEALQNEVLELQATVTNLKNKLKEAQTLIVNMKSEIGSTYNVAPRQTQVGKQGNQSTNLKDDVRERRALANGGKK